MPRINPNPRALRLSPAQHRFMDALCTNPNGFLERPYGYSTAGRDAAIFDQLVRALDEVGLLLCERRYYLYRDGHDGIAYRVRLALPAPAEFSNP